MDNIAYEEFPKMGDDNDSTLDSHDQGSEPQTHDQTDSSVAPPPIYADPGAATEHIYPNEPPPSYTVASAFQFPTYLPPHFQPYRPPDPLSIHDGSFHGHFGVLIDPQTLPAPIVVTQPPTDYLPLSIFNLIFCCLLFGVFGLVKSIATRSAIQVGDYNLAYMSSLEARNWNIAASVTGGIIWTLVIVSVIVVSTI